MHQLTAANSGSSVIKGFSTVYPFSFVRHTVINTSAGGKIQSGLQSDASDSDPLLSNLLLVLLLILDPQGRVAIGILRARFNCYLLFRTRIQENQTKGYIFLVTLCSKNLWNSPYIFDPYSLFKKVFPLANMTSIFKIKKPRSFTQPSPPVI